jgi:hypothetical protein
MCFTVTYNPSDYTITGSSSDNVGGFTVNGTFDGNNIEFLKAYHGGSLRWLYKGRVMRGAGEDECKEGDVLSARGKQIMGTWANEWMAREGSRGGLFTLMVVGFV